ncbi:MAG: hypothetical protein ACI4E1_07280 [Lachnospira sp.]
MLRTLMNRQNQKRQQDIGHYTDTQIEIRFIHIISRSLSRKSLVAIRLVVVEYPMLGNL